MNVGRVAAGIPIIALGAMIFIEGILVYIMDSGFWLGDTNPNLSIALGIIALIAGSTIVDLGSD